MDISELEVYRLAEDFVVKIYQESKKYPREELFGITSQIRRASLSIPLNIAEGFGRYHYKDRLQFLYNARGSLVEVKSLLNICERLQYLKSQETKHLQEDLTKIHVKLNNYIKATQRRS
ncbi:MAG: hypothetical protein A3A65_03315 [Candidatus Chisholmbacteria bacterium RIFCSPLOWO2_01_FULL_49_14]|uniref:Four helix bundle protein n=1 Tax=Candidatus Chisholmbacteria bacterium RIFCSPLOWO2_01_FULL_49_14 TaxID=1797593 RepID=A0A1G1W128_9BACT|nr:MAG: hypothetical protein A3A65_03315 [Candidatus Chisholmbacteria bacterium RIFCSPLOWO2_01_FULL_49_14]